jgi:hypothetical protein
LHKSGRRPFFVHYRSPDPCTACLCYALGSILFWDWFFRAFGAKSGFSDRNSPELAHTIPGKFFPYPLILVSRFRAFAGSCGHHIYPGLTIYKGHIKFGSSACPLPCAVRTISLSLSLCMVPILTNWVGLCYPLLLWFG